MKSILSFLLITIGSVPAFSQIKSEVLKIFSITEYVDGFVIKAINASNLDTLNIISPKDTSKSKKGYERMLVGEKYTFKFEDLVGQASAMPHEGFVVRIETTIVWKAGDSIGEIPVFGRNTKGSYIQKE